MGISCIINHTVLYEIFFFKQATSIRALGIIFLYTVNYYIIYPRTKELGGGTYMYVYPTETTL